MIKININIIFVQNNKKSFKVIILVFIRYA